MKIILLNGPPGCGKDTLAKGIVGGIVEKFAAPIKQACRAFYSLTEKQWDDIDNDQFLKVQPNPLFGGKTCRKVQINMSELYAKPTHDKSIFGKLCAQRIKKLPEDSLILISDSGFKEEAEELISEFGAENVKLVRIFRPECTFGGDSRSYINLEHVGVMSIDLINDKTIEDALLELEEIINE